MNSQGILSSTKETPHQNEVTHLTLLTFKVTKQTYSLPVSQITRIIEMVTITQLPQAPHFVQGIINIAGKTVLIIDLNLRFGLPSQPYGLHTPIILTQFKHQDLGLVVEAVDQVLEVDATTIENSEQIIPPELLNTEITIAQQTYLKGVVKKDRKLIPILDLETFLTTGEHAQLIQATIPPATLLATLPTPKKP